MTTTVTLSPGHLHSAPWEQPARCPKHGRRLMTKPKASPLPWLPGPILINGAGRELSLIKHTAQGLRNQLHMTDKQRLEG